MTPGTHASAGGRSLPPAPAEHLGQFDSWAEHTYFVDDARIVEIAPRAAKGDETALDELRAIYRRGNFDPGFGRELQALLGEDE